MSILKFSRSPRDPCERTNLPASVRLAIDTECENSQFLFCTLLEKNPPEFPLSFYNLSKVLVYMCSFVTKSFIK
jgi:hypothetical protein